ncbi:MAG: hypothetical protein KKF44_07975 [Nanoarchaeota archaeon]|nr:hypothetical protein [Nanoarchaeota archaeon]
MKKAEISIFIIFSVLISIAAISLLFVLIGQNSDIGKNLYCRTIYQAKAKIWEQSGDSVCEDYTEFDSDFINIEEDPVNEILQYITKCWYMSRSGRRETDILCSQLIVRDPSILIEPLTEKNITDILLEREICHIIANNLDDQTGEEHDCGSENNIRFLQDIVSQQKILIEYIAADKQVVIS